MDNDLFKSTSRIIQIRFDGGCAPSPGQKYGSYEIRYVYFKRVIARATRFSLGYGTNNEAEFESLLKALHRTQEWIETNKLNPKAFNVRVITDSIIVRNHLLNKAKPNGGTRRAAMIALSDQCKVILRMFHEYSAIWEGRAANVEVFGH